MPYRRVVIGSKEGSDLDGLNVENPRGYSWRASAKLGLQGTVPLGWDPLGLCQECDNGLLNRLARKGHRGSNPPSPPEFPSIT